MSSSYGHTYLTSYGWTGSGTGLRKGAIDKPLAIPPKKNISGLGKDRDEAFPFWDHLFTVASKAITIKLSSDDEDTDDESKMPHEGGLDTDANVSSSDPLRRTTTGILSNRRPASGTPATTSGSTTPDPAAHPPSSLLVIAKREAAKRGLYARFFKGPVLGPDDDGPSASPSPSPSPSLSSGSRFKLIFESKSKSVSAFMPEVAERVSDRDEVGEAKKSKKRKSKDDGEETREQRRERKRLKRERKAVRVAKRAEKALKKREREKDPPDGGDQKDRNQRDEGIGSNGNGSKKARKHARKYLPGSGDRLDPEKRTRRTLAPTSGQQETSHEPHGSDVVRTSKKKRKRKDTSS